jgi:hypothetical protein
LIDIRKIVHDLLWEELGKLEVTPELLRKKVSFQCPEEMVTKVIPDVDDPMDIDITWTEDVKDLATVEGIINGKPVSVVLDSASNRDILPGCLANDLKVKRNTNSAHLRGISGITESSESATASVALLPDCKIETNFTIVENYPVPEVILGRATLLRHNYDLHESRKHIAITCNGKNFFIPIVPDVNRQSKKIKTGSAVISHLEA